MPLSVNSGFSQRSTAPMSNLFNSSSGAASVALEEASMANLNLNSTLEFLSDSDEDEDMGSHTRVDRSTSVASVANYSGSYVTPYGESEAIHTALSEGVVDVTVLDPNSGKITKVRKVERIPDPFVTGYLKTCQEIGVRPLEVINNMPLIEVTPIRYRILQLEQRQAERTLAKESLESSSSSSPKILFASSRQRRTNSVIAMHDIQTLVSSESSVDESGNDDSVSTHQSINDTEDDDIEENYGFLSHLNLSFLATTNDYQTDIFGSKSGDYKFKPGLGDGSTHSLRLQALFAALSVPGIGSRFLRHLCISGNKISPDSQRALGMMVQSNRTLTHLNLASCGLGNRGVAILCDGLERNSTLQTLFLGLNGIGDMGAIAVAKFLISRNCRLKKLSLGLNRFVSGDAAIGAAICWYSPTNDPPIVTKLTNKLAKKIVPYRSFHRLNLPHNPPGSVFTPNVIGESGALALADALRSNRCLQSLDLLGNPIPDIGIAAIVNAIIERRRNAIREYNKHSISKSYMDQESSLVDDGTKTDDMVDDSCSYISDLSLSLWQSGGLKPLIGLSGYNALISLLSNTLLGRPLMIVDLGCLIVGPLHLLQNKVRDSSTKLNVPFSLIGGSSNSPSPHKSGASKSPQIDFNLSCSVESLATVRQMMASISRPDREVGHIPSSSLRGLHSGKMKEFYQNRCIVAKVLQQVEKEKEITKIERGEQMEKEVEAELRRIAIAKMIKRGHPVPLEWLHAHNEDALNKDSVKEMQKLDNSVIQETNFNNSVSEGQLKLQELELVLKAVEEFESDYTREPEEVLEKDGNLGDWVVVYKPRETSLEMMGGHREKLVVDVKVTPEMRRLQRSATLTRVDDLLAEDPSGTALSRLVSNPESDMNPLIPGDATDKMIKSPLGDAISLVAYEQVLSGFNVELDRFIADFDVLRVKYPLLYKARLQLADIRDEVDELDQTIKNVKEEPVKTEHKQSALKNAINRVTVSKALRASAAIDKKKVMLLNKLKQLGLHHISEEELEMMVEKKKGSALQ